MILKASQRGGASALAAHLMNGHDNEHVEVHAINGFLGSTVSDAFTEIEALSKGTRCKQYLFSLSLSPPPDKKISTKLFEKTIERIAKKHGLQNQPHVIVFHEKQGRRHAHCVWSRIDGENMRAINLPYFKNKLMEIGKSIYIEQGWELPNGHIDKSLRNPLNFTLAEWQQAKHQKRDPKTIKAEIKALWLSQKSKQGFEKTLNQRGYYLACGNPRRSFVIVDWMGQVRSLTRHTGAKVKELTEFLGNAENLPSVDNVKQQLTIKLQSNIKQNMQQLHQEYEQQLKPLNQQKLAMAKSHDQERKALRDKQEQTLIHQRQTQQKSLLRGLRGWWQRFTGERLRINRKQEQLTLQLFQQNQKSMDDLIYRQIEERQDLQHSFATRQVAYEEKIEQFKQTVFTRENTKVRQQELVCLFETQKTHILGV